LEFDLQPDESNGKRLGGFALYRKNSASPLWMDLDVFTHWILQRSGSQAGENAGFLVW